MKKRIDQKKVHCHTMRQLLTKVLKSDARTGFHFHRTEIRREPCKRPTVARGTSWPVKLRSRTLRFPHS